MTEASRKLSFDDAQGDSAVLPAGTAQAWWQPQPANGHAEVILSPRNVRTVHPFSFGTQTLPPGGTVRLHAHDRSEEVLFILEGEGAAIVNGQTHRMAPQTTLYLGHNQTHTFTNDGNHDLKWAWFFMPGGLEDFFEGIGIPRAQGDQAPLPFARPENVKAIEDATVFAKAAK